MLPAQTLLDHDFSTNSLTSQNLPTSSAWFKGGGSNALLSAANSTIVFNRASDGSHLLATNFAATSGYTLQVGETLTLRYTFSPSAVPTTAALNTDNRMALFSYAAAPSARLTADNASANGPGGGVGTPVLGYMFTFHVSTDLADLPFQIYERTNTTNASLLSSSGDYTALGAVSSVIPGTGVGLTNGSLYTLQFEINRTATDTLAFLLSYRDSGNNVMASATATDSSGIHPTFDAFVYRAGDLTDKGGAHTISDFSVVVTPVPEPAAYAVAIGFLALGGVLWRRRAIAARRA